MNIKKTKRQCYDFCSKWQHNLNLNTLCTKFVKFKFNNICVKIFSAFQLCGFVECLTNNIVPCLFIFFHNLSNFDS